MTQMDRNTERRIQLTSQQIAEAERKRMESEYQKKSDEFIRKWKIQIDEERMKLQKVDLFSINHVRIVFLFIGI